jgi:hypothetical protein
MNQKDTPTTKNHHKKLGQKIELFPIHNHRLKRWLSVITGGLIVFTSAILTGVQIFNIRSAIATHGRAIMLSRLPWTLTLFCLLLPFGALIIILAAVHWDDGITLYEVGLIQQKAKRKRFWIYSDTAQFDTQIKYIKFAGSVIAIRAKIILEDQENQRIIFRNQYDNMERLINQIRVKILPRVYSKAYRRLGQDKTIIFHQKLRAHKQGLKIKDDLTPWTEIKQPEIKNGNLALYGKPNQEKLFKSNINQIRNLDLLLHLIKNPPTSSD